MEAVLVHVWFFPRAEKPEKRGAVEVKPSTERKEPSVWPWD